MPRIGRLLPALAVVALGGCGSATPDPVAGRLAEIERANGDGARARLVRVLRAEDGPIVVAEVRQPVGPADCPSARCPTLSVRGPRSGRSTRFVAGWAVEVRAERDGAHDVVYGAAIPAARAVELPLRGGRRAVVRLGRPRPGSRRTVFAVLLPAGRVRAASNGVIARGADGRLLGRQHNNDGNDDVGAFDGTFDRTWRR